jgi:hypothetical protein
MNPIRVMLIGYKVWYEAQLFRVAVLAGNEESRNRTLIPASFKTKEKLLHLEVF